MYPFVCCYGWDIKCTPIQKAYWLKVRSPIQHSEMGFDWRKVVTRGIPLDIFLLLYVPASQVPPSSCAPQDCDA